MSVRFFLGANSGDGFYSLYDNFACAPGDRLHLIKAGPGCGKSTFMKSLRPVPRSKGSPLSTYCARATRSLSTVSTFLRCTLG